MPTEHVTSVDQFLDVLDRRVRAKGGLRWAVFRGQGCEPRTWPLLPRIGRRPYDREAVFNGRNRAAFENVLFTYFRQRCVSLMPQWVFVGSPSEVLWNQLLVAQHHGLPTRLLDWTRDPLVALYFAVEEIEHYQTPGGDKTRDTRAKPDAAVVALGLEGREWFSISSLARHNPRPPAYKRGRHELGLLLPPDIHHRITAQSSVFTIGRDPVRPIKPELTVLVPRGRLAAFREELDRLGVNRGTLFPDMDGIAAYYSWSSKGWSPIPRFR